MAENLPSDLQFLDDTESIKNHLRAIFSNRGLPVDEARLTRIAGEVERGERSFVDVRISLQPYAKKNADSGIPSSAQPKSTGIRAVVEEQFPSMVWALDHPELGPILEKAAEEKWTPLKLQGQVQGTDWWTTNSATQRQLEVLKETDPAQYELQVQQSTNSINVLSQELGITLTPEQAEQLGVQALNLNLDERQLTAMILGKGPSNKTLSAQADEGTLGGSLSEIKTELDRLNADYMLGLDHAAMGRWMRDIASGAKTVQSFEQYAQKMAVSQMPFLETFISQGLTPAEGLTPYRSTVARMLEISPTEIDWTNPKYQSVLHVSDGDKQRLATSSEMSARVREVFHHQWNKTSGAKQAATQLTSQLATLFGEKA